MLIKCGFCEMFFTSEQIRQGISLPTMRNQHYRLVEIAGIIHKFASVPKVKKQLKGESDVK